MCIMNQSLTIQEDGEEANILKSLKGEMLRKWLEEPFITLRKPAIQEVQPGTLKRLHQTFYFSVVLFVFSSKHVRSVRFARSAYGSALQIFILPFLSRTSS